jgi:hypothetical protein
MYFCLTATMAVEAVAGSSEPRHKAEKKERGVIEAPLFVI